MGGAPALAGHNTACGGVWSVDWSVIHTVLVPPRVGYTGPHDRQMKPRHEPRTVLDCLALLLTGPIEFLYHKPSHTSSLSHACSRPPLQPLVHS